MKRAPEPIARADIGYDAVLADVVLLIHDARRAASRSVNAAMTTVYWQIGRRLIEREQGGARRAAYGEEVLARLAADLTTRFGRGFSVDRLETARLFYLAYPDRQISATPSRISAAAASAMAFPLSWSHYVLLLRRVEGDVARAFYEAESLVPRSRELNR